MSIRNFLQIAPIVIKQYKPNKLLQNQLSCWNFCTVYNLTNFTHTRSFFNDASKLEVVEGRERIYYGTLTPYIRAVKWFSLTTSACGLLGQPFLVNTLYANQNVAVIVAACSFMGFFTFVTPFLLHLITKRYITHLDYDPKKQTYIASTVNFFCMLKETEFSPGDVKVPDISGIFTTFLAKGIPMFLDPRLFEDPGHYARIMGYDKPMDFKMYQNAAEENKEK